MKLRLRILLLMTTMFCGFILLVWLFSVQLMTGINEQWGKQFVERQVLFDKYRTLSPMIREISLARKMAADPAIIQMALHEYDPVLRQKGIDAMERYRLDFRDRSYFAAIAHTGNYYFNDASNQYIGKQLRYVLSPESANDKWFYATIADGKDYQVNLDPDVHLGVTKVWINVLIKNGEETLGLIGTGLDLTDFLKETVSITQHGVHNLFIDRDMAIQLHDDPKMIDYMSIAKDVSQRTRVDKLLKDAADIEKLKLAMQQLEKEPTQTRTVWVTFEGEKYLLGVAYLPEVGWYDLTLMNMQSLVLLKNRFIVPALFGGAFLVALIVMGFALRRWVINPITALQSLTDKIKHGNFDAQISEVGVGEMGELSRSFADMAKYVHDTNRDLEDKVRERTAELLRSEAQLQSNLDNTPNVAIQWYDETGRVIYWNPASERLYGWQIEEAIGKTLGELIYTDEIASEFVTILNEIKKTGQPYGPYESEFHHRNGQFGWILSTTFMIPLGDGRTGFACMDVDISERKQAEVALILAKRNAEAASQAKSEFLANMSHEIRTPMNSILGMADILSETELNDEQRRYVGVFQNAGNNLLELINLNPAVDTPNPFAKVRGY